MRRIAFILLSLFALATVAQTPQEMINRAVNTLKQSGNVMANYSVKGSQGRSAGTIIMSGTKYRIVSGDMKCWFDGKTMWTYSKMTDEVNITTPTAADLQMSNPYAAAQDFKSNYNMWKAAGQLPGTYAIMLSPKKKSQISKLYLYIDSKSYLVRNLHVKMSDGNAFTITLTNYKKGVSAPASTFTFDKSMVPSGTEVVDLR
ncbi:MAG: outer-membrane lipoprotein carrier protein LolA [Muribaculaceae bacterium]|nr:outer-membrane lipoprotein carrier protein LolA [Muribaculaceae bacterium]